MPQVFYRKWRPQLLRDVVGQDHVTRTLGQAVAQGRTAHAYLFCGPRGTGKTSTARILAKAINCLNPSEGEPCNLCRICETVNEGRAMDLVEIDAASHRGIDDIRNLRDKVHFTPAEAAHKVYIIDEAHMLTEPAFNALLKTLEEPPSHAVFVLATTEAHKVPATVISRCQRFDFHRISQEHILARLSQLCDGEGVKAEPQALKALAGSSSGSLRDAENLLEQLVVSHDSNINLSHVREMLGLGDNEMALTLVGHILKGDVQEGLRTINTVADRGLDLRRFHRQVVDYLRSLLLVSAGAGESLESSLQDWEAVKEMAQSSTLERILRAARVFEQATPGQDGPSTLPLELALVDFSLDTGPAQRTPVVAGVPEPAAGALPPAQKAQEPPRRSAVQRPATPARPPTPARANRETVGETEVHSQPVAAQDPAPAAGNRASPEVALPDGGLPDAQWDALRKATKGLKPNKFNIGALLLDCVKRYTEDDTLVMLFRTRPNMERLQGELENPDTRRLIQEAVEQVTGTRYNLRLSLADQGSSPSSAPRGHLVRAARALGVHIVQEVESEETP